MAKQTTRRMVMAALLAALTTAATMVIRIPTPTLGYIHLGDGMVLICGILLGPGLGAAAAGIGSMLADLFAGYMAWVPGTFAIKALTALTGGLLYRLLLRWEHLPTPLRVLLVVVAILTGVLLRDKPEDAGLWPDGSDSRPKSESEDDVHLTVSDVLRQGKAWKLIVSFGIFQSVIQACMGSMAVWYMSLGGLEVWLSATKWLAMGSILGIPMSYIFGILDDKIGSVKTSMILGATELIPVIALMLQPQGGNVPLMILWGFGVACMTGGVPTMHPCITAYCYGRKEYQSANRVIMSIQLIPFAFAALYTTYMITSGKGMLGYGSLIVLIIIGIAVTASLLKLPDSNAADRY